MVWKLGEFPAVLYFSKLFLCLLQVCQALLELGTKDLRLLVKPGILNCNCCRDREGFRKAQMFLAKRLGTTIAERKKFS